MSIQNFLHVIFFLLGVGLLIFSIHLLERVVWLQIDPHGLKGILPPIVENVLYGFGIDVIVFSYLLVVMLWAITYQRALIGHSNSAYFKRSVPLFITLIILFFVIEIVLRILWRVFQTDSEPYYIIVSIYYLFVLVIVVIGASSFLFYGLRLYRLHIQFEDYSLSVKDRLRRVFYSLTLFDLLLISDYGTHHWGNIPQYLYIRHHINYFCCRNCQIQLSKYDFLPSRTIYLSNH